MSDLFKDKAQEWDQLPIPMQISQGVGQALNEHIILNNKDVVLDFGAGTGLVCSQIAPKVAKVYAVDISESMLSKLSEKEELKDKVEVICQDITSQGLDLTVDVIVSAMAMHHVADTKKLFEVFYQHLSEGGRLALADLDKEDGDFHPPHIEGVYHAGFERKVLKQIVIDAGFKDVEFHTALTVNKVDKKYSIFLMSATK